MNVNITIHPYRLPLICPLSLGGEEMVDRTGWLIELHDANGRNAWGEIAPLPGVSSEEELRTMEEWDGERVDNTVITPSVRCGMDMALFNLGDPDIMPAALRDMQVGNEPVLINALLIGDVDDMVKQAKAAVKEGYTTIKIKLGRRSPADEVHMLHTINAHVTDQVRFRLDVNRAWSPNDADRYLSVISEMNVEYVEEPFANPRASLAWAQGTGVPLALDESLRKMAPEELRDYAGIRAVVLKPTQLGGLVQAAKYAAVARELGAYPVVSAMLESGVGTLTLARFASAICDPDTAVGLDTYRWLATDVLIPRWNIGRGFVSPADWDWSRYRIDVG